MLTSAKVIRRSLLCMLCMSSMYYSLSVHQPHRKGKSIQKLGECVSLGLPTTKIGSQPLWTPWPCNFLNQARLWTCWNARYFQSGVEKNLREWLFQSNPKSGSLFKCSFYISPSIYFPPCISQAYIFFLLLPVSPVEFTILNPLRFHNKLSLSLT